MKWIYVIIAKIRLNVVNFKLAIYFWHCRRNCCRFTLTMGNALGCVLWGGQTPPQAGDTDAFQFYQRVLAYLQFAVRLQMPGSSIPGLASISRHRDNLSYGPYVFPRWRVCCLRASSPFNNRINDLWCKPVIACALSNRRLRSFFVWTTQMRNLTLWKYLRRSSIVTGSVSAIVSSVTFSFEWTMIIQ